MFLSRFWYVIRIHLCFLDVSYPNLYLYIFTYYKNYFRPSAVFEFYWSYMSLRSIAWSPGRVKLHEQCRVRLMSVPKQGRSKDTGWGSDFQPETERCSGPTYLDLND